MQEENKKNDKNSNEGIKFLCLSIGILGILLYIISIFTTPFLIFISIILFILGIVFSAIYKSIAGLIINIIGIALIPIILIFAVILTRNTMNSAYRKSLELNNSINDDYEYYNDSLNEFYNYFNSTSEKVIYYSSSVCEYCSLQTPIIERISKEYDIDFYSIDSTLLTIVDREIILEKLQIDPVTPTTVVVKNRKVISTQVGYIDREGMIDFLKNANVIPKSEQSKEEKSLKNISYNEYKEIINKKDKNIIVIGQTGCGHCTSVKPKLNAIVKEYNITINYLNLSDINNTDRSNLINSLGEIGYNEENYVQYGSFGTPLTLVLEDGKVISYVLGDQDQSDFIKVFKSANIITN